MSTNCWIAKEYKDGIKAIYCHFDGYVMGGVGENLYRNFDKEKDIDTLIQGGAVTSVYTPRKITRMDKEPMIFNTIEELVEKFKRSYTGFLYLYEDGEWLVIDEGGVMALTDIMEENGA